MAWSFDGTGAMAVWTMDPLSSAPTALDVRAAISMPDWTPSTAMTLVSQSYMELETGGWASGTGLFAFGIDGSGAGQYLDGTGTLWVYLPNPSGSPYSYGSGSAVPASANDVYCVRFTFSDTANEVKFFYKASSAGNAETDMAADTGWTQLGSTDTHSQSLQASVNPIAVGFDPWGFGYDFNGTFYGASVATTIDGDPVIQALSSEAGSSTTWAAGTGEHWYSADHPLPVIAADLSTNADPWTDATWVNLDSYITAISTDRRASLRQPGQVSAGTATVTVRNETRAFDPAYTAGPFGTWTPGRRLRVRMVHAGTMYGLFEGYVGNIRQTYTADSPHMSFAELDCIDGWGDLHQRDLTDWLYSALDTLNPSYWWRLGEPGKIQRDIVAGADATAAQDIPVVQNPVSARFNPLDQNVDHAVVVLPTGSYFESQNGGYNLFAGISFADGTSQSVSLWFQTSSIPSGSDVEVLYEANGVFRLGISSTGLSFWNGSEVALSSAVYDGSPHNVTITQSGTSLIFYLDGQRRATHTGGMNTRLLLTGTTYIGCPGLVADGVDFKGTMWDVAGWTSTVLSAANVTSIWEAGSGYDGDTSDERIGRILDAVGWPAGWRTLATGKAVCAGQPVMAQASEMLRQVAASEGGLLFVDRDGWVRFRNRYWASEETTGSTSQATFSDDGAAGAVPYQAGGVDWDVEQWLLNNVIVSGAYGSQGKRTDTTVSIKRSLTVSTLLRDNDACARLAGKIIRHRSSALSAVNPWTCRPQGDEWPTLLGLELGDRITFEVSPPGGVGSQVVTPLAVSRISHRISSGAKDWTVTFEGDPVDPTTYLVLGTGTLGAAGGYVLG